MGVNLPVHCRHGRCRRGGRRQRFDGGGRGGSRRWLRFRKGEFLKRRGRIVKRRGKPVMMHRQPGQ
jgi:hypothetical protein